MPPLAPLVPLFHARFKAYKVSYVVKPHVSRSFSYSVPLFGVSKKRGGWWESTLRNSRPNASHPAVHQTWTRSHTSRLPPCQVEGAFQTGPHFVPCRLKEHDSLPISGPLSKKPEDKRVRCSETIPPELLDFYKCSQEAKRNSRLVFSRGHTDQHSEETGVIQLMNK
jgi:hypothetical protein